VALLVAGVLVWQAPWSGAPDGRSQDGTRTSGAPGTPSAHQPGSATGTRPSAPSSPSSPAASAPVSGTGSLPGGYLGTWKGTITTKIAPLPSTFEVAFTAGRVGQVVGRTANASAFDDTVCRGELTLLAVGPDRIELQERPVGTDPACTGVPEKQSYTPNGAGVLHLQVTEAPLGSDPSGDLLKQG
jgi:hypothetical protein